MGQQCQQCHISTVGQQHTMDALPLKVQPSSIKHMFPLPSNPQLAKAITHLRQKNTSSLQLSTYHHNPFTQQQFIGYLQNNTLKQGYGEFKTSDGKMYFGYFKDNLPHIKGVLIFSDQHYYIGHFIDGRMHGKGKQVSPCFRFDGVYKNDFKHHGKLSTRDFFYEGQFQNNLFDGYGQLKFPNGQKYMGFFEEGQFNGEGIYLTQDEKIIYQGEFKCNLYSGRGKYYWEDGSWFEGEYVDGVKHGEGMYCRQGEQTIHGIWEKGMITSRIKTSDSSASTMANNNHFRSSYQMKVQQVYL